MTRAGETDVIAQAEAASPGEAPQSEIAATLRAVTKLGGQVELVGKDRCPMTARSTDER